MEKKFYRCELCGRIIDVIKDGGPLTCCGQPMTLLKANTTDAATEKHVPAIVREGNDVTVTIGSVDHPMIPEHYIEFIQLVQGDREERVMLHPGHKPVAKFTVEDGPFTVYEYCNLHSLWKAEG